jgi:hypothetical protein
MVYREKLMFARREEQLMFVRWKSGQLMFARRAAELPPSVDLHRVRRTTACDRSVRTK